MKRVNQIKVKRSAFVMALAGFAVGLSLSARGVEAGVPAKCGEKAEQAAFKTGGIQARALLESAFDGLGRDCKRLAEIRALADSLSSRAPEKGSPVVQCKALGFHQGAQNALSEFLKGCPK